MATKSPRASWHYDKNVERRWKLLVLIIKTKNCYLLSSLVSLHRLIISRCERTRLEMFFRKTGKGFISFTRDWKMLHQFSERLVFFGNPGTSPKSPQYTALWYSTDFREFHNWALMMAQSRITKCIYNPNLVWHNKN